MAAPYIKKSGISETPTHFLYVVCSSSLRPLPNNFVVELIFMEKFTLLNENLKDTWNKAGICYVHICACANLSTCYLARVLALDRANVQSSHNHMIFLHHVLVASY